MRDSARAREVGQMLTKDGVSMMVSAIHAREGGEFTVTKFSTLGMINNLQNNLTVTENGKDTGVLSMTFTGEDKDQIRDILNSITRNYLEQNTYFSNVFPLQFGQINIWRSSPYSLPDSIRHYVQTAFIYTLLEPFNVIRLKVSLYNFTLLHEIIR